MVVGVATFYMQSTNTQDNIVGGESENTEGIVVESTTQQTDYIVGNLQDVSRQLSEYLL